MKIPTVHADPGVQPVPTPLGEPRVYKNAAGRGLKIYAVPPKGWTPRDKRPAIVFFHGGGWTKGTPAVLNDQAAFLQSRGIVCFLAEYRLIGDKDTPEVCIRDAKSAMRWVRGHAAEWGVDSSRIAAGGGSAGAHLAAAAALVPGFEEPGDELAISPGPQALVLFNPVIDNGPGGYGHHRVGERYREFSPAHNVAPGAPPALVMSGTEDKLVPVAMLEKFRADMQAAGARCELRIYEGGGHGFYRKSDHGGKFHEPTLAEIEAFFRSLGWL